MHFHFGFVSTMGQHERESKASALALNLQAEQYSFMRRVDQHFLVENKLQEYGRAIESLSRLNQTAIDSICQQEQRLKELQSKLQPNKTTSPHINAQSKQSSPDSLHDQSLHCETTPASKCAIQSKPNPLIDAHVYQTVHQISTQAFVVTLAEVTSTSFTLSWDPHVTTKYSYDVEIRYSCIISGEKKSTQFSCSKWILKEPVPKNGRLTINGLQPNTEYNNVCLRFKSHLGWSDFSKPIDRIYTSEQGKQLSISYRLDLMLNMTTESTFKIQQTSTKSDGTSFCIRSTVSNGSSKT